MTRERPGRSSRIEDGLIYSGMGRKGNYRRVETAGPQPKGPKRIEPVPTTDPDVLKVVKLYDLWQEARRIASEPRDPVRAQKFDAFNAALQGLNETGKRKTFFDAIGIKEDTEAGERSGWGSTKEERRKKP